jgi:excisionase family DNA binding protein
MTQRNTGRKWDGTDTEKGIDSAADRVFIENQISSSNWLTTIEAAEYLRTSPNQIRNWVYQGKIRAYRLLGKSLRFRPSELDLLHKRGQSWE